MREGPSAARLASAVSWGSRVSSWLGPSLLADSVPVLSGRVTSTVTSSVPDGVSLRVPRFVVSDGRTADLLPTMPDGPLARYGQQLDVSLECDGWLTRTGRFLITDWDYDEETITVKGAGLLQLPADDRLTEPTAPRTGGSFASEFSRMLSSGLTAQFEPGLVNRDIPQTMEWDEDRLANLYEIADAWPAVVRMDPFGGVQVQKPPVAEGVPAVTLTDGVGGTVVRVPRKDTRSGSYNVVVATSSADGVEARGVAAMTSGPMAVAQYGSVPKFFSSKLLLTDEQCRDAAVAMLPAALRASSVLAVQMAPDPRLELDDFVAVVRDGHTDYGLIVGLDIPLTVGDGEMRVDVGVVT